MAYSTLADSQIDGDSPLIADTMFKLRDNPLAIISADPTAPKLLNANAASAPAAGGKMVSPLCFGQAVQASVWVKIRGESRVNVAGTYTVTVTSYGLVGTGSYSFRVYINGAAAGTTRTTSGEGPYSASEDFALDEGDIISIYATVPTTGVGTPTFDGSVWADQSYALCCPLRI